MTVSPTRTARRFDFTFGGAWPLVLGFAVLAIPTLVSLAQQTWSQEFRDHGPIVLATGAWVLWRQAPEFRRAADPGRVWLTMVVLAGSLIAYVFGRAYDFITLEVGGLYGVGLAILQSRFGVPVMVKNWFPLFYLALSIPPPSFLLDSITAPLKRFVSMIATNGLHDIGYPVAREGVTIFVAQYQLLVEDACSGLNSIIGLIAISLLYIYLMRGSSWRYAVFLTFLVIPIAIVANILRIVTLVLLTYYFGDEVAQGFIHFTAGLFLFTVALALVFAIDSLIFRFLNRRGGRS